MTNINQIHDLTQALGGQPQQKSKTGEKAQGFESVLNSALDKTESAEEGTQAMGLGEIAAPAFDLETPTAIVTGKTDKLLEMLDNYASQLENPEVTLRNIEPVLEEINADAASLLEDTRFLGEEDSQLKDIATQTVVAAQTEYLKFQRGDYLS
ncbi:MAG: hypothetical protein MI892_08300 [Desulfobacterales bacterium]|nr:hypothetical protein [Desulfobacterales bacterium]